MARPLEYDRQETLMSAMNVFWRQGYNATKLPHLLDCTGLSRSSFYAAFGDKRQLFFECFEFYTRKIQKQLELVRQSSDPAAAIYHYFSPVLGEAESKRFKNGCFVVNTLLEFEDIDPELHELARSQTKYFEDAFKKCFESALQQGKLNTPLTPKELTQMLATLNAGIQVKRRAGMKAPDIKSLLDIFINSIGGKPLKNNSNKPTGPEGNTS
jgi:TetR/AcrR family transcriptional repressor of nem operon